MPFKMKLHLIWFVLKRL